MQVNANLSCRFQDRNRNDVVILEVFKEFPMAQSDWVVRTTNHIYANQCVKKFDTQADATTYFGEECERFEKVLAEVKSEKLSFRNRFFQTRDQGEKPGKHTWQDDGPVFQEAKEEPSGKAW